MDEEGKRHYAAGKLTSFGFLYKRIRAATSKCLKCGKTLPYVFPYPVTMEGYHNYRMSIRHVCMYAFGGTCEGRVDTNPEYISAINVELIDDTTLQQYDLLKCILFGNNTIDVGVGENATVESIIHMETPKKNGETFPIGYVQSIVYENREETELRSAYIEGIRRFRRMHAVDDIMIKQLVSMMACDIYGLDNIKEGILYMAVNAKPMEETRRRKGDRADERRERLHGALIGKPGLGKSALLRYASRDSK